MFDAGRVASDIAKTKAGRNRYPTRYFGAQCAITWFGCCQFLR
ncbi:hypothetical protein VCR14J2_240005 [Vibrio coralliirubri]|nr:hypothetical protein VCR14J2_240005 [Vibrio coralliirubri]